MGVLACVLAYYAGVAAVAVLAYRTVFPPAVPLEALEMRPLGTPKK